MEKRLLVFLACLFLNLGMALAQIRVSGTVSSDDGEPVVGASILVQGTKTGTVTDVDGNFQLTAPEGCELKVSYLGMKTKNVKVAANLKIVLQSDNRTLDDVVVTALGVSREKKALGYAVSEVKGSDLIKSRGGVSNPVNALQGKVAGLQISSSSGSMGGSSKIIIRGASSLSGNNQPLFVVDGVPIEGTD